MLKGYRLNETLGRSIRTENLNAGKIGEAIECLGEFGQTMKMPKQDWMIRIGHMVLQTANDSLILLCQISDQLIDFKGNGTSACG